jgi:hypothetical protein
LRNSLHENRKDDARESPRTVIHRDICPLCQVPAGKPLVKLMVAPIPRVNDPGALEQYRV